MRLIDADALLDRIRNPYEQAEVARWVNEQPTIEPERKTGRWMATEADEPCFYRCSECGRLIDERENYCPNCGAKMEGES